MYFLIFIIFFVAILLIRLQLFTVHVVGRSMMPNYQPGETLIVWKYHPRFFLSKGKIVVLRFDNGLWNQQNLIVVGYNKLYVKRLIALSGDNLLIKKYDMHDTSIIIPPDYCFVSSDLSGLDSYTIGPVPQKNILGVVIGKLN